MNRLIISFVLFILVSFVVSCDGRGRKHKSNIEVLKENKLLDSFSENITYHPIEFSEVITDTILDSGYNVSIKVTTDMKNSVLEQKNKDSLKFKNYFRKLICHAKVSKDSKTIFDTKINELFFNSTKGFENLDLNSSIISIVFDQIESVKSDSLVITSMIFNVKTNKLDFYDITIDHFGNHIIKKT